LILISKQIAVRTSCSMCRLSASDTAVYMLQVNAYKPGQHARVSRHTYLCHRCCSRLTPPLVAGSFCRSAQRGTGA
jgi:hypothetical protein